MGKRGRGEVDPIDDLTNIPRQTRSRSNELLEAQRALQEQHGQTTSGAAAGRRGLDLPNLQVPSRTPQMAVPVGVERDGQAGGPAVVDDSVFFGNPNDPEARDRGCRCGRTKCLKQYCQCFRNDTRCGTDCMCDDCHNDGQHEKERISAIRHIRRSNATAFKGTKLEVVNQTIKTAEGADKQVRGCRCKRSRCMKKYCECFGAGLTCTINCVCTECENGNTLSSPRAESGGMTKAQQKVQPMQFKAYAEVYTSKRGNGSMGKSAHGGEPHHGQHGSQQMQAERGQGPGRGGHSDSGSNRHSNTGNNNAGSGMGMSAPAAQMSNYHDRKRPDMRVFVANPAALVGQQPQMMYPPQYMGQQQMMEMGASESYNRQMQQTPNGGFVMSTTPLSLAHGMQSSLSGGVATPSVSTPVGGVWPMGMFPQGQPPMWGGAQTPGGGVDVGNQGGQMLRSDGTLVDGYGAQQVRISPSNGTRKAQLAVKVVDAMRDSLQRETSSTVDSEAPPLLRDSSSGFVPPAAWDMMEMMPRVQPVSLSEEDSRKRSPTRKGSKTQNPNEANKDFTAIRTPVTEGVWPSNDMEGLLAEPTSARAWASNLDPKSREASGLGVPPSPLGAVGASPRLTGDSPRLADGKRLSKEYSGLGMFDKGSSGSWLTREVSWGLMKESSGLAGGLLDNNTGDNNTGE